MQHLISRVKSNIVQVQEDMFYSSKEKKKQVFFLTTASGKMLGTESSRLFDPESQCDLLIDLSVRKCA